jgi:hypothetical protein
MLNIVLLVHAFLAVMIATLAIGWPNQLAKIGTFSPSTTLDPEGQILSKAFGVCLFLVGSLAWGAWTSASAPARRLTVLLLMLHLLIGGLVALFAFPPGFASTAWLMVVLCVLLFVAYAYVWLFVQTDF